LGIPKEKKVAIKIKLNLTLQTLAGNREKIEVTGSTIKQCLNNLIKQIPGAEKHIYNVDGSLKILFLLNEEALQEQDLDHPVTENDELWLLSIVSGG
jgi:molybdopterin converting factor small subunit